MLLYLLKLNFFRNYLFKSDKKRIHIILSRIEKFLPKNRKILDIGSGLGMLASTIITKGYDVTPLDIHNISIADNVSPIIYNGLSMPFNENQFDTSLLITVLHHTPDPESIIKEAARVSNTIIIMEDIYENTFQKYMTCIMDSVLNLEFVGHPHTNKTETEWLTLFKRNKLQLLYKDRYPFWNFFLSAIYIVKK